MQKQKVVFLCVFIVLWLAATILLYFVLPVLILLPSALIAAGELHIRRKQFVRWLTATSVPPASSATPAEVQETPAEPTPSANLITSISKLLVKDFIICIVDGDLSALGTGTEEQLHECFTNLLSQYYAVKKDVSIQGYIKLQRQIQLLELRKMAVEYNTAILITRYSDEAAGRLRILFPAYQFAPDSLATDLEKVRVAEIANKIKYDQYKKELESREAKEENEKQLTPEEKIMNFYNRLMDINKTEGVKYDMNTMSVLEFALAEYRLSEHIKMLEKQIESAKRR